MASTFELLSWVNVPFHRIEGDAFFVTAVILSSFSLRRFLFTARNKSFGEPCRTAGSRASADTVFCRKPSDSVMLLLRYFTSFSS